MSRIGCVIFALGLGAALVSACTTTRKISQVGLREIASVNEAHVSELRSKIVASKEPSKHCPVEIRENFSLLAGERVRFPTCPEGFAELMQGSLPFLKLEERSSLDEVLSTQCRSIVGTEYGDTIEELLSELESGGASGRRGGKPESAIVSEADAKQMASLKSSLHELVEYHLPLDRWVKRNGQFVLPDEELEQLGRLVDSNCRLADQELEHSYRTIRSLEELAKILREGPQRQRIESFLAGMNKVIEQKLKEFFYP